MQIPVFKKISIYSPKIDTNERSKSEECKRGMHGKKKAKAESSSSSDDQDTPYRKKCRITWAMLIKAVFEVDPLKCPKCGGAMKIVSFIEEDDVISKILKHSNLWKEPTQRPPPKPVEKEKEECEPQYDYSFFDDTVYCDML